MNDTQLANLALSLHDGERRAGELCPSCDGGRTKERTLSLTRDKHRVFYKCWRASCDFSGCFRLTGGDFLKYKERSGVKFRELETTPKPLDEEYLGIVKDKWNLTEAETKRAELGLTTLHTRECYYRLYIPLFRYDGTVRGYVARDVSGLESKKALTFKFHQEEPNLGWHVNRTSKNLILVEDAISSIRASSYLNAACLLSTQLDKGKVDELIRNGFTKAYLALDKDATRTAIKLAANWNHLVKLNVIALDKDLKDMEREELRDLMENL